MNNHNNNGAKLIIKNSLALYLRMAILLFVGLFTSRVTLSALGIENYGIYNLVIGILALLSFVNTSISSTTQRFIAFELGQKNYDKLKKIINNSIVLNIFIIVIIVLLAETIGLWLLNYNLEIPEERLFIANIVYQISILQYVIGIINSPFVSCIIAHEQISIFTKYTIIEVIIKLLIAISLLYVSFDKLLLFAILLFINSNISRVLYVRHCKKNFDECKKIKLTFDKGQIKELLSFSSWTLLGNSISVIIFFALPVIANIFFGILVNAALAISNQIYGYASEFISNFNVALNPQITKTFASRENNKAFKLVINGCKYTFFLTILVCLPLIIETDNLLHIWLKEVPQNAVIFVQLILLITILNSYTSILTTSYNAIGNIKTYQIIFSAIFALYIPIVILLYKNNYEAHYCYVVYSFIFLISQIIRIIFVCKRIKLKLKTFFKEVVSTNFIVLLISVLITLFVRNMLAQNELSTFIVCFTSCISIVLSILLFGLNRQERGKLINIIKRKIYQYNE